MSRPYPHIHSDLRRRKPRRCKYCGKVIPWGTPVVRFGHYGRFHPHCLVLALRWSSAKVGYKKVKR